MTVNNLLLIFVPVIILSD